MRGVRTMGADDYFCSLETVGRALGVSRERVRQIEQQALRKCERWARLNGYRAEDLLGGAGPSQGRPADP